MTARTIAGLVAELHDASILLVGRFVAAAREFGVAAKPTED